MFKRFGQLFSKMVEKVAHFIKNDEKSSIWPKLATLRGNYHVSAFLSTFQQKVVKSGSFREKWRQIIDLAKTLQLLEQAPMSLPFDELFRKKLQKVPSFEKQHENWSIWPKICNFSSKLPSFGIYTKSLAESWKKSLILWKRTKNRRFGQNFATFGTRYHVFAFRWTFQKKVAKSASFLENARKIIDFVKTCNFSKKLPCFGVSIKFSAKSFKKCLVSWRSTKNHGFGQSFGTFRANYYVLAFWSSFQEKYAKSASFHEKARKVIDLDKSWHFIERTTMSLHFDELFRKRLWKVPRFVKTHEKSSIWPKLWNFSNKLPCFDVQMKFSAKTCKKCLISWKRKKNRRFGQNFASFRTMYHVFAFRSSFKEVVG